jgi:hypothetical protein
MGKVRTSITVAVLFALGACASAPHAPSVSVLPGGGKSMEVFNTDDIACRVLSAQHSFDKGPPTDGMGLGTSPAVVEPRSPEARRSDTETGTGSMFGGAPAQEADNSFTAQQRYDTAYLKCMFSKGHQVPVNLNMSS